MSRSVGRFVKSVGVIPSPRAPGRFYDGIQRYRDAIFSLRLDVAVPQFRDQILDVSSGFGFQIGVGSFQAGSQERI